MKIIVSWSGGKDSSYALYEILKEKSYDIMGLLSTFTEEYDRITMHEVRRSLIYKQAESIGLPIYEVYIPANASNEVYNKIMGETMEKLVEEGLEGVVFGDIFLEDVRRYREENLYKLGVKGIFPLWHRDTSKLAIEFVNEGFKAIVVSIDSNTLDEKYLGMQFNLDFLNRLPSNVDPCGENGEFHTFVYYGPIFTSRIYFKKDISVKRDRFYYQELIPL